MGNGPRANDFMLVFSNMKSCISKLRAAEQSIDHLKNLAAVLVELYATFRVGGVQPSRSLRLPCQAKALPAINAGYKVLSDSTKCYHEEMKQIITRVDDDLADSLKRQASRLGESLN
jgi:hypothetical protein